MGKQDRASGHKKPQPSSTTSLGKRRRRDQSKSPRQPHQQQHQQQSQHSHQAGHKRAASSTGETTGSSISGSTMSNPKSDEYGSQVTPGARAPTHPKDLVKVAILGAGGGIGQPLALMMMLHSEYIHHLALHDLVESIHGVGLDLSHCDRQVKVTSHCGPDAMAEAVRGARVIVIPAGLAQRPGMSRDDLFGSNAKIMYNIAKCCAQNAPEASLAIISNPVNSLVPLTCEVYARVLGSGKSQAKSPGAAAATAATAAAAAVAPKTPENDQQLHRAPAEALKSNKSLEGAASKVVAAVAAAVGAQQPAQAGQQQQQQQQQPQQPQQCQFEDCFRRIFGVTTLDVVRASTLTAKSTLFKNEPNGLFKDPAKVVVPVVGGHAGRTIMPLLSQAQPKLDKKRLAEDKSSTLTLIESIQQAGIEVLNAKKGRGSATLAMAYSACRFTLSLLRAQAGEANVVECAYVRHATPPYGDMEYFATPLLLGKDGYVKPIAPYLTTTSGGPGGHKLLLPFEQHMLEEGSRELRLSIVKGEDFAREQLSADTLP